MLIHDDILSVQFSCSIDIRTEYRLLIMNKSHPGWSLHTILFIRNIVNSLWTTNRIDKFWGLINNIQKSSSITSCFDAIEIDFNCFCTTERYAQGHVSV